MAKPSPIARQGLLTSDHLGLWPPTHVLLATLETPPGLVWLMESGVVVIQLVNVSYQMLILLVLSVSVQLSTVVPWATPPMEQWTHSLEPPIIKWPLTLVSVGT